HCKPNHASIAANSASRATIGAYCRQIRNAYVFYPEIGTRPYRRPIHFHLVRARLFDLGELRHVVSIAFRQCRARLHHYRLAPDLFPCDPAWEQPALLALAAWATVRPSLHRIWAPDVARTVTGKIDGNIVTLSNVRDFIWHTPDDFTPNWKEETFDLDKITSVDVYLSYWSNPAIAHTLLSFGFADGRHVVFSGEIRREHHEVYSPIAGFFRKYELAMIAADERDIIYLRTNIRKEDVYRYRVKLSPAAAKALFLSYVEMGNELAKKPEFYNTLTTNCTTIIFQMVRLLDPAFPFDYRVLLSGYLPGYLYDHGWLENGDTLEKVRERASIDARAQASGREDYSQRIRE
ncbi:LOW QUALITY PROTEIN: conserved hypothetical protein, partial [Brucella ceti M644/93/1]